MRSIINEYRGPLDDQLEENAKEIAKLKTMVEDILPEECNDVYFIVFLLPLCFCLKRKKRHNYSVSFYNDFNQGMIFGC